MSKYSPQKKLDETWLWIKHRLELQGLSLGKLARIHGIHRSAFFQTKNHNIPKYERILADLVGLEPWEIWPDRYDAAHKPVRITTPYQGHKAYPDDNRNKSEVNRKDIEAYGGEAVSDGRDS